MNLSREAKGEIMQGWLRRWRRGKGSFSVLSNPSAARACDQPRLQGSALPSMGHPRSEHRTRGLDPPASLLRWLLIAKLHSVPDVILSPGSQQHISASMFQIITASSEACRENASLGGQSQEQLIHN